MPFALLVCSIQLSAKYSKNIQRPLPGWSSMSIERLLELIHAARKLETFCSLKGFDSYISLLATHAEIRQDLRNQALALILRQYT
jgi:hypothetical protein